MLNIVHNRPNNPNFFNRIKMRNTMLLLHLQVLLEEHQKPEFTGNLGLNHLNSADD